MGKYPKSKLNDAYSNFHYQFRGPEGFNKTDYMADVDRICVERIWIETRNNLPSGATPVVALDIKEPGATITETEIVVYNWLEEKGLPVFIVHTTIQFQKFIVRRHTSGITKNFNRAQYINFINALPASIFL